MVLELTKLLKEYYDNKRYADKDFVYKANNIIVSYYKLNDYVKDIEFAKTNNSNELGNQYLSLYKVIWINMYKLHNEKHYRLYGDDYYGLFNLFVLKTIFHEISHANDEYIKDNEPTSLEGKLLILDDPFTYINVPDKERDNLIKYLINKHKYNIVLKYYNRNYFQAPHERMAITRSCIDMMNIIKVDFIVETQYYEMFKSFLENRINSVLYNYHLIDECTNNPSLEYLWGLFKNNHEIILKDKIFYNYNLDAEDRLFYGLSLSKNEYENIDNIKNNLIKKKSII